MYKFKLRATDSQWQIFVCVNIFGQLALKSVKLMKIPAILHVLDYFLKANQFAAVFGCQLFSYYVNVNLQY